MEEHADAPTHPVLARAGDLAFKVAFLVFFHDVFSVFYLYVVRPFWGRLFGS